MGILDDAIRQHLELKRQHGAASSDLDRLEQEAFGPVARPGDPEFETGEEPAQSGEDNGGGADESSGSASPDWLADEDPTTIAPQAEAGVETAADPESVEQPIPEPPESAIFDVDEDDLGEIDLDDGPTPAERAREEHAELEDTVDHPAPKVASLSEELEAAAPESQSTEAPATGEPESIEFDELPGETVEPAAEDDESDEDLLEETPDFLKEAPEGEDLWFEQKGPKDFDFDD